MQGPLHYAIIDEVDNILIDEARTPLIISGPAHDDVNRYRKADRIARQLKSDVHFEVNEKEHTAHLTDEGVRKAEQLAGVESFYTAGHMEWPHLIDNALKAHHLYKRDVNYVVKDGEVVIVDEFTGRLMPGRNWSDGLHQAVEAKEGVRIKEENQTLATITLQNFFKLYDKICGMTGTAMTEAAEFWKIYKLDVIAIPTNKPLRRINHPDVIYRTRAGEVQRHRRRDRADAQVGRARLDKRRGAGGHDRPARPTTPSSSSPRARRSEQTIPKPQIAEIERRGRPMLVGTVSIEQSELISGHAREAGRSSTRCSTPSTTSAKRRSSPRPGARARSPSPRTWPAAAPTSSSAAIPRPWPGPAPGEIPHAARRAAARNGTPWSTRSKQREQMKAEGREVAAMGGLHIIGTERHEARRIDLQLRGRCGRQGDPGQQPLLPLAGRRPDADLRRRVGQERPHPAGHEGRRGHRKPHGLPPHRRRPEEGRGAQLRRSARTCSNTTR